MMISLNFSQNIKNVVNCCLCLLKSYLDQKYMFAGLIQFGVNNLIMSIIKDVLEIKH